MDETTVTYTLLDEDGSDQTTQHSVRFDYLVYSLGSYLPAPINIWAPMGHALEAAPNGDVVGHPRGTKLEGVDWMKAAQKRVKDVNSVLVVGGGALGVRELRPSSCLFSQG
jgi:NADH dehydrogenase FAD-containing subunit